MPVAAIGGKYSSLGFRAASIQAFDLLASIPPTKPHSSGVVLNPQACLIYRYPMLVLHGARLKNECQRSVYYPAANFGVGISSNCSLSV